VLAATATGHPLRRERVRMRAAVADGDREQAGRAQKSV
jgi:hypothetical protein